LLFFFCGGGGRFKQILRDLFWKLQKIPNENPQQKFHTKP